MREETGEELAAMQKALGRANLDSDYYRGLNENLLRIFRERANADRNLPRKKDHAAWRRAAGYEGEGEIRRSGVSVRLVAVFNGRGWGLSL